MIHVNLTMHNIHTHLCLLIISSVFLKSKQSLSNHKKTSYCGQVRLLGKYRCLLYNPDNLNLIPGGHAKAKEKNQHQKAVLLHLHVCWHVHLHTPHTMMMMINNKSKHRNAEAQTRNILQMKSAVFINLKGQRSRNKIPKKETTKMSTWPQTRGD